MAFGLYTAIFSIKFPKGDFIEKDFLNNPVYLAAAYATI